MENNDGRIDEAPEARARPGEALVSLISNFLGPKGGYSVDDMQTIADPSGGKKAVELLATRLRHSAGGEELAASARTLPLLLADRQAAVDATLRLAREDRQFRQLVATADAARDHREWAVGEYNYWRALALYPLHRGYIIQYAHCIREQNKFPKRNVSIATPWHWAKRRKCASISACVARRGVQSSQQNVWTPSFRSIWADAMD